MLAFAARDPRLDSTAQRCNPPATPGKLLAAQHAAGADAAARPRDRCVFES